MFSEFKEAIRICKELFGHGDFLRGCPFCGNAPEWDLDDDGLPPKPYFLLYCKNCYENSGRTVDCTADTMPESGYTWWPQYQP